MTIENICPHRLARVNGRDVYAVYRVSGENDPNSQFASLALAMEWAEDLPLLIEDEHPEIA